MSFSDKGILSQLNQDTDNFERVDDPTFSSKNIPDDNFVKIDFQQKDSV